MMRSIYILSFFILCFSACREDTETLIPTDTEIIQDVGDVNRIYNALQKEAEIFSLNGSDVGFLFTGNGTKVTIPPHTFLAPGTDDFLEDEYTIEIVEVTQKADFLRLNKSAFYNDTDIILTQAAIFFNPIYNGEKLEVAEGKTFEVEFLDINPIENLATFTIPTNGSNENWTLVEGAEIELSDNSFTVNTDLTNWINCAFVLSENETTQTAIQVELAKNYSPENTTVYLLVEQFTAAIKLSYNSDLERYTLPSELNLPMNEEVRIVAISNRTKTIFHFGEKLEIITEENDWFINLDVVNINEIDSRLSEL